jgi:hypothetical protein
MDGETARVNAIQGDLTMREEWAASAADATARRCDGAPRVTEIGVRE